MTPRVTWESLGALTADRGLLERGQFGALSPWECDRCGPLWEEPKVHCAERPEAYYPGHYVAVCPKCGWTECADERVHLNPPVKLRGRRRVTIRRAS